MRARLVAILVLLVSPGWALAADDARHDLIVTLDSADRAAELLDALPGAVRVGVIDAVIVRDASPSLEARLAAAPGVVRIDRAAPLELHSHLALRLTRSDATPRGLGTPTYTGAGVTVAVIDSGIDATHPALRGRVKDSVKLVDNRFLSAPGDTSGHGTQVAGIVAADDGAGAHHGVAPGASLVGLDITDRFTTASALLAYDWLFVNRQQHDIQVAVNAWGRTGRETFDPTDPVIRAIDRLVDSGVVVVFSTSNHGPKPSSLSFESQNPRVISVGATNDAAVLQPYSSRGPSLVPGVIKPDVVAPGERILSLRSAQSPLDPDTDPDPLHRELSGTSQAVPHVAGVIALMLEANPTLTPTAVQNALHEAAIDLGAPGPDDETGFGLIDARDSVRAALGSAPDRRNTLVAGGTERYEDTARVAPGASGGLLGLVEPAELWSTTFPVKPGADTLRFSLAWQTAAAPLSVTLEEDGAQVGTWSRVEQRGGQNAVTGELATPPPGMWTLRVRGATPTAVEVTSTIDVTLPPNATRAQALDARFLVPEQTTTQALAHNMQVWWIEARLLLQAHPWAAPLVLVACLGTLYGLNRARKRA